MKTNQSWWINLILTHVWDLATSVWFTMFATLFVFYFMLYKKHDE